MWIAAEDLQTLILQSMGKTAFDSDSVWPAIADKACADARQTIITALLNRGFSAAQSADWDAGEQYQRDIGLYFALTRGGAGTTPDQFQTKFVQDLDRRGELATAAITINGDLVNPDALRVVGRSPVAVGRLSNTQDLFRGPPRPWDRGRHW